jgi:hypothetical protein
MGSPLDRKQLNEIGMALKRVFEILEERSFKMRKAL